MEEATAKAAAHAINALYRRRQACSTRRPINCVSLHAFALANRVMNACVSLDQRPAYFERQDHEVNSAVRSDQPRLSSHLSLASCFGGQPVLVRSHSPA